MVRRSLTSTLLAGLLAAVTLAAAPQQNPGKPQQSEIRGVVLESGTDQPVAGADIELSVQDAGPVRINGGWKSDAARKARTDITGSFVLSVSGAGSYRVEAKKAGYLAADNGPPAFAELKLTKEQPSAEAKLYLVRPGRITGRAVDAETGRPMAKLTLYALHVFRTGGLWPNGPSAVTNAEGEFEVKDLAPGQYAVEVRSDTAREKRFITGFTAKDTETIDQDYEHTYWPGGRGADAAQPVTLGSGATVDVGKIAVRMGPYYRVHVRIPIADCAAGDKMSVGEALVTGRSSMNSPLGTAPCGKDLLVTRYTPGNYRLNFAVRSAGEEVKGTAMVAFTIIDKNLEVTASILPGVAVDGAFSATEGARLPDLTGTRVMLRSEDGITFTLNPTMATAAADGSFRIEDIRLVDQRLIVMGLPAGYYLREVRYNGARVERDVFAMNGSAMAHKLALVLDDQAGSITGTVSSAGDPVANAMVVAQRWPPPPDSPSYGMATARSDGMGRFQLTGLVPGDYHAIAVRAIPPAPSTALDEELKRALSAAEKIEVGAGNIRTVALKAMEWK
jgi:hypothetical protein